MKKYIIILLISCGFCNAQLINNCATTNSFTKRDANGNLVCSNVFENGNRIDIGTGTSPFFDNNSLNISKSVKMFSAYFLQNTFMMTSSNEQDKFSYFINENKATESVLWRIGNSIINSNLGTKDGFSVIEGSSPNQTRFFIQDGTGNVGIGTNTPPVNYKLAVAGKIIAEELKVQLQTQWPDYVFAKDYKLPTLNEVENHIIEKGHLMNVPSAKEVKENGIELGEMAKIQHEKIEELTLYIIEQNKINEKQSIELEKQNKKIEELKTMINILLEKNK